MIGQELRILKDRIQNACTIAARNIDEVGLVLVTKEVDLDRIKEAYEQGFRDFGENRVQDLVKKQASLPSDIKWHFIGHLQTNKVKQLKDITLIHSCDRIELAQELERQAEKQNQIKELLIQVNASGEKTKHGFHPKAVESAISEMQAFKRLKIRGLMTIGPNTENVNEIRSSFRLLRMLRDKLKNVFSNIDWRFLSMGMSSDFEIAIEEGANLLRIGRAVFGARKRT